MSQASFLLFFYFFNGSVTVQKQRGKKVKTFEEFIEELKKQERWERKREELMEKARKRNKQKQIIMRLMTNVHPLGREK